MVYFTYEFSETWRPWPLTSWPQDNIAVTTASSKLIFRPTIGYKTDAVDAMRGADEAGRPAMIDDEQTKYEILNMTNKSLHE